MHLVDLTHLFRDEMPVFPGDPTVRLTRIAYGSEDGFTDYVVTTAMHVGTHLDGPLHMIESGLKLSDMPLEAFVGPGKLIDARGKQDIGSDVLAGKNIKSGDIVFFFTGWGERFGTAEYFSDSPVVTEECAEALIKSGVKMVGFDAFSPDRAPYSVHKMLLGQNILIAENLCNLEALLGVSEFEISALPVKFEADSAPVRVVARIF